MLTIENDDFIKLVNFIKTRYGINLTDRKVLVESRLSNYVLDHGFDNFADYLKTYSENTQFVVVTHRKGTMARCDALYGVAMEEKGVSKLMSVKLQET